MQFEADHIYHIYNQGNNRQKIFFDRENYIFFLRKIRIYMTPFVDILAWCLMPNHFHLMVYVREVELPVELTRNATLSRALSKPDELSDIENATPSRAPNHVSLNKSIGIMLASYTRAINKQKDRSGSLFRDKTKAECITECKGISPSFFNTSSGAQINVSFPEQEYSQICFDYIHENPLRAKIVKNLKEWEFSSYLEYAGLRNGTMIDRERAEEFGLGILFNE